MQRSRNTVWLTIILVGLLLIAGSQVRQMWHGSSAIPATFTDIYREDMSLVALSPFELQIDPMKQLLLLNFDDDPDDIYLGFEPQLFDDAVHGQGLLVIGWRVDGYVDVYHQPGLALDSATYSIAGKGLGDMLERPMTDAHFEITASGVDCFITFEDKLGRPVELRVVEHGSKARKPFSLLAPMGDAATNPKALPLVFLHGFYFVRKANSEVSLKVAGETRKPGSLPVPIDGSRVYFLRYAHQPVIATWNPAHDGPLAPLELLSSDKAQRNGVQYDLVSNQGQLEIAQMLLPYQEHEVSVQFTPAFPNLLSLRDGLEMEGNFSISAGNLAGRVSGEYSLKRQNEEVSVHIRPSGGWQPNENKWSVRFMYQMVPTFTNWPKTYEWTAVLNIGNPAQVTMRSSWQRTQSLK